MSTQKRPGSSTRRLWGLLQTSTSAIKCTVQYTQNLSEKGETTCAQDTSKDSVTDVSRANSTASQSSSCHTLKYPGKTKVA